MIIDVQSYLESLGIHRVENELKHYGTPRHSGRYPWGSGGEDTAGQRNKDFLGYVNDLKRQGLSEVEIAQGMGMSVTQLRTSKSIAKNAQKAANVAMAQRLKEKNYSNVAIGERMGIPESSVRALLAEGVKDKLDVLQATATALKTQIDNEGHYLDVGTGTDKIMGISRQKLDTAVALLREQGYAYHNKVQVDQIGTGQKTTMKILAKPGTEYMEVKRNLGNIRVPMVHTEDGGRSFLGVKEPLSISSKRVGVRYKEDGGHEADGVIYVRPGVHDVSIGNARYAQVRIAVDGSHYLKGMAVYKDDLPAGVDLMFNTNKSDTGNKLDALKKMKKNEDGSVDMDNPFGAVIRQRFDEHGKVSSVMNIVGTKDGAGEEGSWETWSKNLPSQFLSKQSPTLAKQQLDETYTRKKDELDAIMRLTNPAVKRKLLESYADGADSSAVHLKAAALPRQSTHVILPVNSMKPHEIYAPNFNDGERVALVRFPHGGTFEIPELTVNNRNREAVKLLGKQAKDAVGIHHKVAERLSGADFDGDTVLVIPNNSGRVKSTPALEKLKNFDAKAAYPKYDGMKVMDARTKAFEMGDVSNLITDMTIGGAHPDEIARAVRHSMVVIDAEKHELNYRQSSIDNNIPQLKEKYQGKKNAGAATLISRASSRLDVNKRKSRVDIDPNTGEKIFTETGESWVDKKGKTQFKKERSTKLAETKDARTLVSINNTKIENIYADHSNRLKALANNARLAQINTKSMPYSPSAKKAFDSEVQSLNSKLNIAIRNRPLERQAQVIANTMVDAKRQAKPGMDSDELKKVKFQALDEARRRTGAGKERIVITDNEWAAIQAGAITNAKLTDILNNADLERVKQLATPKADLLMTSAKTRRAESMAKLGYTQAEIASALGVSVTTLKRSLEG